MAPSITCSGMPSPVRLLDQQSSVVRVADGRRGHRDDPGGAGAVGDRAEVVEGLHDPRDGLLAELAGVAEVARQAERRASILDHVEVLVLAEPEDDHPSGVRTDVDHGERPVIVERAGRRFHGPMVPRRHDRR